MTVKIVQGLVGYRSGYQEIRVASSANSNQTAQSATTAQQATTAAAQVAVSRTLSDAVVSSVRSGRGSSAVSEKIREIQEAKEVSRDVADKIRDGDSGVEAHNGIDQRTRLAN